MLSIPQGYKTAKKNGDPSEFVESILSGAYDHPIIPCTYSSQILKMLNDYVSNINGKENHHTFIPFFIQIFDYATQFNHANIMRIISKHIPSHKVTDDIMKEIINALCKISLNFPVFLFVSKKCNAFVKEFLLPHNRTISQQQDNIKKMSSCWWCSKPGLLKVNCSDYSKFSGDRSYCIDKCDKYCENRDCENFGYVVPALCLDTEKPLYCRVCHLDSMTTKSYHHPEIKCSHRLFRAKDYAKCKKIPTPEERKYISRHVKFTLRKHACKNCHEDFNHHIQVADAQAKMGLFQGHDWFK